MPQRRKNYRRVLVTIDQELCDKVDLLLFDSRTSRVKYGSRSKLINALLRDWLDDQIKSHSSQEEAHGGTPAEEAPSDGEV